MSSKAIKKPKKLKPKKLNVVVSRQKIRRKHVREGEKNEAE